MSSGLFDQYHAGALGIGPTLGAGALVFAASVVLIHIVLLPLWRALLQGHPDRKAALERGRRARNRAWVAALSAGVLAAMHGGIAAADRLTFLPYRVGILVTAVLGGAILLDLAIVLLTDFVPVRSGRAPMSQFFKDVIRSLALLGLSAVALRKAFPTIDLGQLLATSAVLSIVIGLALQESLSNIFSGLMLTIDEPYRPGDWIEIDGREGRVLDSNWRTVRILTRDDDVLYVPNRTMAGSTVLNFSSPTPLHRVCRRIGIEYGAPPNKVCQVLVSAMKQVDGVLAEPAPDVLLADYGDSSITYEMRFWLENHQGRGRIESDVMRAVWYQLKRNGISIPFPIRDVYLRRQKPESQPAELLGVLKKVDILAGLSEDDLRMLAEDLGTQLFARGEVICRQGDAGSTFYIVKTGQVAVSVAGEPGEGETGLTAEVAKLGPGAHFGEVSLLTGAPRSSTVRAVEDSELLVLDRDSFSVLIAGKPTVAQHMSEILAARESASRQKMTTERETRAFARRNLESEKHDILEKIRSIFRFR
ncbi:MAG: mechanosensitive ion channel [Candidatus Brocadiae bacterium]|nr:mechanosensitive ion channel [Candidatus Brocadiia bacterium]